MRAEPTVLWPGPPSSHLLMVVFVFLLLSSVSSSYHDTIARLGQCFSENEQCYWAALLTCWGPFAGLQINYEIKYPGADMDITLSVPSFCCQISPEEFEYQRAYGSQEPLASLLEEVITDAKLSTKEKKKKLKQFQKSYPEVYRERFPTPESEALLFPEKSKPKPQLLTWALKNPFQPFQRTRSFRM